MIRLGFFVLGCVSGVVGTLVVVDLKSEDSFLKKLPQKWDRLNTGLETKEETGEEENSAELEAAE